MASLRRRLGAAIAIGIGFVTLRRWRQRRAARKAQPHGVEDPETASEHAAAATEHARLAAEKAIEKKP